YLDQFPVRFRGVKILRHPGVNLAPWNLGNYRLSIGPHRSPYVDGLPVIFYHFSRLRRVTPFLWGTNHRHLKAPTTHPVRTGLYEPYLAEIMAVDAMLPDLQRSTGVPLHYRQSQERWGPWLATLREIAALIVRGGGVWVLGGRVY